MNYQRFRPNRWYTDWSGTTEKNDAQGIEQRLTLGGGLGRYVLQSNFNQLSVLGGLVATRESFTGTDPDTTNAEGKVEIAFLHQRKDPDANVTFTMNYFPRLNELGNFRSDTNLSWRREFVEDLFFDLSVYYKYLSDPPAGAQNEDYGVVSSLGYSF